MLDVSHLIVVQVDIPVTELGIVEELCPNPREASFKMGLK
jgi:hypothetical protein